MANDGNFKSQRSILTKITPYTEGKQKFKNQRSKRGREKAKEPKKSEC
jgi:hypothetical protein